MANAVAETNEQGTGTGLERAQSGPQRLTSFLHDVREEMRKVVTPSRSEVQNGTIVVIVTVFLFAAYFALIDLLLSNSLDKFFLHLSKH